MNKKPGHVVSLDPYPVVESNGLFEDQETFVYSVCSNTAYQVQHLARVIERMVGCLRACLCPCLVEVFFCATSPQAIPHIAVTAVQTPIQETEVSRTSTPLHLGEVSQFLGFLHAFCRS